MTGPAAAVDRARGLGRLPGSVWLAATVTFLANTADNAVLFVVVWVAGPQGWTGAQTAVAVLGARLPGLISGGPLGRAVDRWGARPLLRLDLGLRCLLLLALAMASRSGTVPLTAVLTVGCLCGTTAPATYAGIRWLLPRVAPAPTLGRANMVLALADQLTLVVAAASAGPALALLGAAGALLAPCLMLLAAAVLAARLPPVAHRPAGGAGTRTGRRPVRRPRPHRVTAVVALSTAYYLVYGPFETVSPAYVRERLASSAGVYTWLWLLFGLGAVCSLPLAPRLARCRPGLVNACGALIWGLTMLPLVVITDAWIAAGVFLVGGAVWGPYTAVETTALQRWTAPADHGGLFGVQRGLLGTATPLGAAVGAAAVAVLAPQLVLAASAGGCAVAGLLALASRDLRSAR